MNGPAAERGLAELAIRQAIRWALKRGYRVKIGGLPILSTHEIEVE